MKQCMHRVEKCGVNTKKKPQQKQNKDIEGGFLQEVRLIGRQMEKIEKCYV